MGPVELVNRSPFSFTERKLSILFDLSLELVDLESKQLLRSHVHEVKQLFNINDSIDPFIVDDHFMDALAHLLSSPAANSKMGQSLSLFAFVGVDQAIDDDGQHGMSPNRNLRSSEDTSANDTPA